MTALAVGIPDARTTKEKITEMTKTLEKWIADIQYQAIKDNYLVLPRENTLAEIAERDLFSNLTRGLILER